MMKHQDALAALAFAASWRKASYSSSSGCVEIATVPGYFGVRDTKLGAGSPVLAFTTEEWAAFVAGVRDGEFDGGVAHVTKRQWRFRRRRRSGDRAQRR